ncbi:hypothetical protein QF033_002430 [Bacillus pumilus]|nr:hypothetical protein [Bacillus pumilus]
MDAEFAQFLSLPFVQIPLWLIGGSRHPFSWRKSQ